MAVLLGGATSVPADTPTLHDQQLDVLDEVLDGLSLAEDGTKAEVKKGLSQASREKQRFVRSLIAEKIYEDCDLVDVITLMETVDISLDLAGEVDSTKEAHRYYKKTYKAAKKLSKLLGECAHSNPGFMEGLNEDKATLVEMAKDAMKPDAVINPKAFKRVKEDMISDAEVYGCEVWQIYTRVEELDGLIDLARKADFHGEDGEDDRQALISKAYAETVELINYWKKVPCGEGGTGGDGGDHGGGDGGGTTNPLIVDFIANPSDAVVSEPVKFTAFGGSQNVTWTWDFGDGSPPVTGAAPAHAYNTGGTFTVTVTASDGTQTATATHQVNVHFANCTRAPTAGIMSTYDPLAGPPGGVQVQLSAQCDEFIRAGDKGQFLLAPASKEWFGYNARTDSATCGNPGPGTTVLECDIKPDGTVCWHLYGNPNLGTGDVIIYRIRKDGVTIAEFPVTVQSTVADTCTP